MKTATLFWLPLAFLISVVSISFGQETTLPPEVEKGIAIKIEEYKKRREKECLDKVLKRAAVIADSLMKISAFQIASDTIKKPPKPIKPVPPEFRKLQDTLPVKPLFPNQ